MNIRKITLINIKVDDYNRFKYFMNVLSKIQAFNEIEYSYDKNSEFTPDMRNTFIKSIKSNNFTNDKIVRCHQMQS